MDMSSANEVHAIESLASLAAFMPPLGDYASHDSIGAFQLAPINDVEYLKTITEEPTPMEEDLELRVIDDRNILDDADALEKELEALGMNEHYSMTTKDGRIERLRSYVPRSTPHDLTLTVTTTDDGMYNCLAWQSNDAFNAENNGLTNPFDPFDILSYSFVNQMSPKAASNPFLETNSDQAPVMFHILSNEVFTSGDSDITLRPNHIGYNSTRVRPISILSCNRIQYVKNTQPLKVLFDSGSDRTMFNRRALPPNATPRVFEGEGFTGIHGSNVHNNDVLLADLIFPEFSPTQKIPGPVRAIVFDNDRSVYDIILGLDILNPLGFIINCDTKTIHWNENFIEFHPADYFSEKSFSASFVSITDDPLLDEDEESIAAATAGYKSKTLLSSLYEEVDTDNVAKQQKHLLPSQQSDLARILSKYKKLFSGKLGQYPHRKIHLDLKEGATPRSCRPYPVPRHQHAVFKEELQRLCKEGVLSPCGASHWLFPTFLIPKKDGRVRWISDFRQLNELIKRRVYNLPKIQDILTRRHGYKFFTKIDISMHYYTFELDDASKELCTICTPFGNYRYNRLPMGVSQSPDVAQEIMEDLFRHIEETDV